MEFLIVLTWKWKWHDMISFSIGAWCVAHLGFALCLLPLSMVVLQSHVLSFQGPPGSPQLGGVTSGGCWRDCQFHLHQYHLSKPQGIWERVPSVTSESHLLTPSSGSVWCLSRNTQHTEKFIKGSVLWDVWSDHTGHNGAQWEGH